MTAYEVLVTGIGFFFAYQCGRLRERKWPDAATVETTPVAAPSSRAKPYAKGGKRKPKVLDDNAAWKKEQDER